MEPRQLSASRVRHRADGRSTNRDHRHPRSPTCALLLTAACAVALASCDRIKNGSGVDPMTNASWAEIDMASPDYGLQLWVQCDGDTTKIGLKSQNHLTDQDGVSVMVKFPGDQTASEETWATTTNHKDAIRQGADDAAFITRLITSRSVQVRMTPVGSDVLDTSFDTSNFAERLGRYRDRCGWGDLLKSAASQ